MSPDDAHRTDNNEPMEFDNGPEVVDNNALVGDTLVKTKLTELYDKYSQESRDANFGEVPERSPLFEVLWGFAEWLQIQAPELYSPDEYVS